jgi:hypothetical protein
MIIIIRPQPPKKTFRPYIHLQPTNQPTNQPKSYSELTEREPPPPAAETDPKDAANPPPPPPTAAEVEADFFPAALPPTMPLLLRPVRPRPSQLSLSSLLSSSIFLLPSSSWVGKPMVAVEAAGVDVVLVAVVVDLGLGLAVDAAAAAVAEGVDAEAVDAAGVVVSFVMLAAVVVLVPDAALALVEDVEVLLEPAVVVPATTPTEASTLMHCNIRPTISVTCLESSTFWSLEGR